MVAMVLLSAISIFIAFACNSREEPLPAISYPPRLRSRARPYVDSTASSSLTRRKVVGKPAS